MEAEHDNIAVLTVIEGRKGDRLRPQIRDFSAEDVGGGPLAGQRVRGNRPGLHHVVAVTQAKPVVGRVECHCSYLATGGQLNYEGFFEPLGQQVQRG